MKHQLPNMGQYVLDAGNGVGSAFRGAAEAALQRTAQKSALMQKLESLERTSNRSQELFLSNGGECTKTINGKVIHLRMPDPMYDLDVLLEAMNGGKVDINIHLESRYHKEWESLNAQLGMDRLNLNVGFEAEVVDASVVGTGSLHKQQGGGGGLNLTYRCFGCQKPCGPLGELEKP